jgi:hypothetical protein
MPIALPRAAQRARAALVRFALSPRTGAAPAIDPARLCNIATAIVLGAVLVGLTASARAQTWSLARSGPVLWQITSLDRSGEPGWPYGAEDIAGDGVAAFGADEAAADLRSAYADADGERLWLRAYVAATTGPTTSLVTFFFIDTDGRVDTGGPADGDALEPSLGDDPTRRGYERALGVRGDGTALGAWDWSVQQRVWLPLTLKPTDLRAEAGRARDPLAIGAAEHGYVQVDAQHTVSGLDASCGGTIFVRTRNLAAAPRAFGDDDRAAQCRLPADVYGDPVVLRDFTCRSDVECPASGRCRGGVCLFAYECTAATDCPVGTHCTVNRCVRVVDQGCTTSRDCNGLLCEGGACVACADVGQRACGAGLSCSPNGACIDPDSFEPGAAGNGGPGKVQGGAFSCSTRTGGYAPWSLVWTALALGLWWRRKDRQRTSPSSLAQREGRSSR